MTNGRSQISRPSAEVANRAIKVGKVVQEKLRLSINDQNRSTVVALRTRKSRNSKRQSLVWQVYPAVCEFAASDLLQTA